MFDKTTNLSELFRFDTNALTNVKRVNGIFLSAFDSIARSQLALAETSIEYTLKGATAANDSESVSDAVTQQQALAKDFGEKLGSHFEALGKIAESTREELTAVANDIFAAPAQSKPAKGKAKAA